MHELTDILEPLDGVDIHGVADGVTVTDLTMRSGSVVPDSAFFCVRGSTVDGHDFAGEAIRLGARVLFVDHVIDSADAANVVQVVVPDVRASMGPVADAFFDYPTRDLAVFGVTGTNGKTTTSHLLRSMLDAAGRSPGIIGTIGAAVGGASVEAGFTTPEAIELHRLFRQMLDAGDRSCAIEVSSHALDQHRSAAVRYEAVGFSNLTRDHLDYHRSFEAYYVAKRRLFQQAGPEGQHWPAAINCDDEWGTRLFDELVHADRGDVPVWGYTVHGMSRASVTARYTLMADGTSVSIESPTGDFVVRSHLRGRFNVENILCATTMALLAGIDPAHIQGGIDSLQGVRGRFEPIDVGQPFGVYVDYAHTPDSLEQMLSSARDISEGRVIVVFGCGGDRDRTKRPHMGRVAGSAADIAIVTSDNPRSEDPEAIIRAIQGGMRRASAETIVEPDRRLAIAKAVELAESGDVVIIAGKGHEQGQIFGEETIPFDDASEARDALGSLAVP